MYYDGRRIRILREHRVQNGNGYSKADRESDVDGIRIAVGALEETSFCWDKGVTILYSLSGEVDVEIHKDPEELTKFPLEQDQIYIFGNEEIHRVHSDADNTVLIMNIDYDRISSVYDGAEFLEFDVPEDTKSEIERRELTEFKSRTLGLAEGVLKAGPEEGFRKRSDEYIRWMIEKFEIVERKLVRINQLDQYYERLLNATDFIQENFNNQDVLKQLAETQFINPAYISHVLKDKVDYNYRQLINFYRVGYAIKLLLGTNYNMTDISTECGFSATRYFYKEFKKFYEEGPKRFRDQYRDVTLLFSPKNIEREIEDFRAYKKGKSTKSYYTLQDPSRQEGPDLPDEAELRQRGRKCCVLNDLGEVVGIAYVKQ